MPIRYYQREAIDAIFAYWQEDEAGNPLVDMATGTGKSLTMATLTQELVEGWAGLRVFNVAHREELVEGNFKELLSVAPFIDAGIYAASLGRRDSRSQVIFGQIQTVFNKAQEIGHIDVLEIDEVHLLPREAETQYGRFVRDLLAINPDMKIVGFSATPYRLDSGRLDEGDDRMFDKVVYTYSISQGIEDGYLSPLSSKGMVTSFDLTGVGTLGGDYKKGALQAAVDKDEITAAAVAEAMVYGADKRTVLWFCSGVDHAEHVRDAVRAHGKTCEMLTGNTPKGERRRIIADLKSGKLWGCTNDAVLTVGTNIPNVDMIVDLAPTKSCSRFVQKAGRGTRPIYRAGFDANDPRTTAEERREAIATGPKPSCLYLDYAKAVAYHGPVDKARPRTPGSGKGEAPVKQCPRDVADVNGKFGCDELLPISIMTCTCCGYVFPPSVEEKITRTADAAPIISTEKPWFPVLGRTFAFHPAKAEGKQPTVKATYEVEGRRVNEWLCPAHEGFPKGKADRYWVAHGGSRPFPKSVDEFLDRAGELAWTAEVQLDFAKNPKYPDVVGYRSGPAPAANDNAANDNAAPPEPKKRGNLAALKPRTVVSSEDATRARLRKMVAEEFDDEVPF